MASQGVNRGEAGLIRDNPIQLAELREESIGKQDLASPEPASSPGAVASPAAETNTAPDSNSKSDDWKQVPAGGAAASDDDDDVPAPNAAAVPAAVASPATPAEIAPAIDAGSIATTPNVSDSSLQPLIDTAPTPARAASLRITERQRVEMERGHSDDAVRELAHAISIDPSNSYAYFYLGRAYIARRDYVQAETFFKRAE
ncbi:MAG TPA: tetratricopeptide repeat protein, partial [Candidatus Binatus sp.]|nr:tetratricopeptide repeat protein [Candidatus Binatus sp.]